MEKLVKPHHKALVQPYKVSSVVVVYIDHWVSKVLDLGIHIPKYRFRNFDWKYLVQFLYCIVPINQESHLIRPIIFFILQNKIGSEREFVSVLSKQLIFL